MAGNFLCVSYVMSSFAHMIKRSKKYPNNLRTKNKTLFRISWERCLKFDKNRVSEHFLVFFVLFSSGPQVNLDETCSNLYDHTKKSNREAKVSDSRAKNCFLVGMFGRICLLKFLLIWRNFYLKNVPIPSIFMGNIKIHEESCLDKPKLKI